MEIKNRYPDKKIIGVFEPHTYSRTQEFALELANILNECDACYVKDIYSAREKQADYPEVTKDLIINHLNNGHSINDDEAFKLFEYRDDVILFMSPKQMSQLENELKEHLENE